MSADQRDDTPRGYGKPPRHRRFVKGRSGNPRGRPKGRKNLSTLIEQELNSTIIITENGVRKKITKREGIAKRIVNNALSGDPKAVPILLAEARQQETVGGAASASLVFDRPDDHLMMGRIIERIRGKAEPGAAVETPPEEGNGSESEETP
jgi:hypothetical protein